MLRSSDGGLLGYSLEPIGLSESESRLALNRRAGLYEY